MKSNTVISRSNFFFCCLVVITITVISGCTKSYLEAKPDQSMVLPDHLPALQAVLDNDVIFNSGWPSAGEISSDNLYITDDAWDNLHTNITTRNLYVWGNDVFNESIYNEWFLLYQIVFESNTVLDNIDMIQLGAGETENDRANIKGQALFFRGMAFYELAQLFTLPYDSTIANNTPGIPLKLSPDINSATTRSSLAETYSQILNDLKTAASLLPKTPKYLTRPSLPAAYGALARVYLEMQKYDYAGLYADSCLQIKNSLLDYNTLNANDNNPIPAFNTEVILYLHQFPRSISFDPYGNADSTLYASYNDNDLRKVMFFKPNTSNSKGECFYGSYTGNYYQFCGVATDEIMLIKAEAEARQGNISLAMQYLNSLLEKRYAINTFIPYTISNNNQALNIILEERRKEMVFRGQRWADLRRLNKETRHTVTVKREIEGVDYLLQPNDKRYALLIPEAAISASRIEQNPR